MDTTENFPSEIYGTTYKSTYSKDLQFQKRNTLNSQKFMYVFLRLDYKFRYNKYITISSNFILIFGEESVSKIPSL